METARIPLQVDAEGVDNRKFLRRTRRATEGARPRSGIARANFRGAVLRGRLQNRVTCGEVMPWGAGAGNCANRSRLFLEGKRRPAQASPSHPPPPQPPARSRSRRAPQTPRRSSPPAHETFRNVRKPRPQRHSRDGAWRVVGRVLGQSVSDCGDGLSRS